MIHLGIFNHILAPWEKDLIFESLITIYLGIFLLLIIADLIIVLTGKKYTFKKYYNVQFYVYSAAISCLLFVMFFWYISIPLVTLFSFFVTLAFGADMKMIDKNNLGEIKGLSIFAIKKQKQEWLLKSETEKQNYLINNENQVIKNLNYIALFICTYLVPIVLIAILMLFGVKYKFF